VLLSGVDAISRKDVWAVGHVFNGGDVTITLHWNGTAWKVVPSPNPAPTDSLLLAVSHVSPTSVWAAGYQDNGSGQEVLVERWTGSAWKVVSTPAIASARFYGIGATADGYVWAGGTNSLSTKTVILARCP
jgi:hypothetical protein